MATVADLAKACNVSKSTVSRVLNQDPGFSVSPATKKLIMDTAAKMGYRLPPRKKSPKAAPVTHTAKKRPSRVYEVGILSFTLKYGQSAGPYYNGILSSMVNYIEAMGYTDQLHLRYIIDPSLSEFKGLDALVVIGKMDIPQDAPEIKKIPNIITVDYHMPENNYDCVIVDFRSVMRLAVSAFEERGIDDIHFVGSTSHITSFGTNKIRIAEDPRLTEFRILCTEKNIDFDSHVWMGEDFGTPSGYEATHALLKKVESPKAIIFSSGEMALGGYKALHEKKLKIGKDVFVIGIDEMDFSRYMQPPLTTISINVMDTGKTAAYDLISLLEGRPFGLTLHPSVEMIRRESC